MKRQCIRTVIDIIIRQSYTTVTSSEVKLIRFSIVSLTFMFSLQYQIDIFAGSRSSSRAENLNTMRKYCYFGKSFEISCFDFEQLEKMHSLIKKWSAMHGPFLVSITHSKIRATRQFLSIKIHICFALFDYLDEKKIYCKLLLSACHAKAANKQR